MKPLIDVLHEFCYVDSTIGTRPPLCRFVWGSMGEFKGVVESVGVKYTLFMPDGSPVRATVQLKMKQADKALSKDEAKKDSDAATKSKKGATIQDGPGGRPDAFAAAAGLTGPGSHRRVMEMNSVDSASEFSQAGKVRTT